MLQRCTSFVLTAAVAAGLFATSVLSPSAVAATESFPFAPSITSTDNADGTYDIPLLRSDVPDVSVTRVPADENDEGRDIYYMVSTTMHLSPGAPIMKSYDLVNWEIVNYAFDRISVGDEFSLRDGQSSYGQGQWASSIRYHDGMTYVLFNTNNLGGAYMLYTDDPENGTWERVQFGRGMHDPTLFFDDANGGDPYVFYGNGAQTAVKLDPENDWAIVEEYPNIFRQSDYDGEWTKGLFEGSQLAYIDGMYYMVMITSGSGFSRQVLILRSPYLLGRYDERSGGENTYEDRSGLNSNGYAQGSLVEVDNGDGTTSWHGFFFRDTYPWGRIPALIPAEWPAAEPGDAGWPVFGRDGVVGYPDTFDHLIDLDEEQGDLARAQAVVTSDDFYNDAGRQPWTREYERWGREGDELAEVAYNGSDLRAQWQWNHAPDNRYWSLTDRDGWLRLAPPSVVTGEASHRGGGQNSGGLAYLEEARNTLSQRVVSPRMSAETHLDFSGLGDGDTAGLAVYQRAFSYAAARNVDGELSIGLAERSPDDVRSQLGPIDADEVESFTASVPVPEDQTDVYLRVDTHGTGGQDLRAQWSYSWDGATWAKLGGETQTAFGGWQPTHFMGPRVGLFDYATEATGGHADFDYLYVSDADPEQPVSLNRLDSAIAAADALELSNSPGERAQNVLFWLDEAKRARDAGIHTHPQADAPVERLQLAVAEFLASDDAGGDELVSAEPSASVERLNGNTNRLTVTVTETWSRSGEKEISETFVIRNNAAGTYQVGSHRVLVDTQGGVKIRDIATVE